MAKTLGILGGMGPLASAEFVKTIYELNIADSDQAMPACILYSDPTIPDRTEAIRRGSEDEVARRLAEALGRLYQAGADKVVMPCITAHHFLPRIPAELRAGVLSLIDIVIDEVSATEPPCLMLCTSGTRQAGIFQQHERWSLADSRVVFPDEADQHTVHELIYQLKKGQIGDSAAARLDRLLQSYETNAFIAGCTEIHLLTKLLSRSDATAARYRIIDPLLTVATRVRELF